MSISVLFHHINNLEADADLLAEWGADAEAAVLRHACARFRSIIHKWLDDPLTVGQAAAEYPRWEARTIAEHIRQGHLPQAGEPNAPLVRRGDLFGLATTDDLTEWAERFIDE